MSWYLGFAEAFSMPLALSVRNVTMFRAGFAGVVLEYHGLKICIDPGTEYEGCTHILCTHPHTRHCHSSTYNVELVSPHAGRLVKPGDVITVGSARVVVVDSYNEPELYSGNPPHPRGFGVGYIVEFPTGLRVYYVGDSNLVPEVVKASESVDVLVLPVGGECVMTPEEAAELVKYSRPSLSIPVHFEEVSAYRKFRNISQPYTQVVLLKKRGETRERSTTLR